MERVRAPRTRVGFDRLGVALMLAAALCALIPYGWIASLPLSLIHISEPTRH